MQSYAVKNTATLAPFFLPFNFSLFTPIDDVSLVHRVNDVHHVDDDSSPVQISTYNENGHNFHLLLYVFHHPVLMLIIIL